MKKRLTSYFLLFALAGGVLGGTPFRVEKMDMMDCCPKAMSNAGAPVTSMARLCCALNCSDSAPTSSSFSTNFPSSTTVVDSISAQIGDLFKIARRRTSVVRSSESPVLSRSFQPRYIQHHSFLI